MDPQSDSLCQPLESMYVIFIYIHFPTNPLHSPSFAPSTPVLSYVAPLAHRRWQVVIQAHLFLHAALVNYN